MGLKMTISLEVIKAKVDLDSVNIIESAVRFGKDINFLNIANIERRSQYYNGIKTVETIVITDKEEGTPEYGYLYHYSVGNRIIKSDALTSDDTDIEDNLKDGVLNVITATFGAFYTSADLLSLEEIVELGKNTVGNDVWPSWREYLQSTCLRMNIPIESLPMYDFSNTDIHIEDME